MCLGAALAVQDVKQRERSSGVLTHGVGAGVTASHGSGVPEGEPDQQLSGMFPVSTEQRDHWAEGRTRWSPHADTHSPSPDPRTKAVLRPTGRRQEWGAAALGALDRLPGDSTRGQGEYSAVSRVSRQRLRMCTISGSCPTSRQKEQKLKAKARSLTLHDVAEGSQVRGRALTPF